jgi:hypothetical protein
MEDRQTRYVLIGAGDDSASRAKSSFLAHPRNSHTMELIVEARSVLLT